MAAAVFDLLNEYAIDQGSQFTVEFQLKLNGAVRNIGTPIAYSVRGQIRENYDSTTIVATFVCTVTDAANGKFKISLTPLVTKLLTPGKYLYDIEIYQSGNDDVVCERVIKGKVEITPEVTK